MSERYGRVTVLARAEWRQWLDEHHATSTGVWAVTFKKSSAKPYVAYEDLVEEALCFGWIDSVRRTVDDESSRLLMTPRKVGSRWSRANKERIDRLVAADLLTEAGQAAIDRAKADGTWDALDEVENLVEPDDLAVALDSSPDARRHWDAFPPSTRRGILEWILSAKRPETRARRIADTAEAAAENVRANQWRQPSRD